MITYNQNFGYDYISRGQSYNIPNRFFIKIQLSTDYYTLICAL